MNCILHEFKSIDENLFTDTYVAKILREKVIL